VAQAEKRTGQRSYELLGSLKMKSGTSWGIPKSVSHCSIRRTGSPQVCIVRELRFSAHEWRAKDAALTLMSPPVIIRV
jgi:hypothetical protein